MNIEEKVKMNLLIRGFNNNTQLNNRGLIGATIDETILEVVKNLSTSDVSCQRELFIAMIDKMKESDWKEADNGFAGRVFDRLNGNK